MALKLPAGREGAFVDLSDGERTLCYRSELGGSPLAGAIAEPEKLFSLDGVTVLADHTNRLATIDLPEAEGLPRRGFVKAFGRRGLFGWLRRPRAERAWNAGCEILARGIATPEPLAVSIPASGPRREGVLITEFLEGRQVREYLVALRLGRELPGGEAPDLLLAALGRFVRSIHDAGVFHGDLGGGNILVTAAGDDTRFALVDVTRCRFGPATGRLDRLRDLSRIRLPAELRGPLIEAYSAVEPVIEGLAGPDRILHPLYRAKLRAKRFGHRVAALLRGR